jgi:hypothetical protein
VLRVTVADGNGGSVTSDVTVTVTPNHPPVITGGASVNVTMSEDGSPTAFALTLQATDADGDPLTWTIATAASHGTASAGGTGASQAIGYAPTPDYYGTDSFVVQVADGQGGTDTITVNVTIQSVNDVPTISVLGDQTIAEDGNTGALAFTIGDVETPAASLTLGKNSSNTTLVPLANIVIGGSGAARTVTVTPTANESGTATITVTVTDGAGGSAAATFLLTVTAVNDAPVALARVLGCTKDKSVALTLTATDADGDGLTYSVVSAPAHGTLTGTAPNVTYTPAVGYLGADSFAFKANEGTVDSAPATVSITVKKKKSAAAVSGGGGGGCTLGRTTTAGCSWALILLALAAALNRRRTRGGATAAAAGPAGRHGAP